MGVCVCVCVCQEPSEQRTPPLAFHGGGLRRLNASSSALLTAGLQSQRRNNYTGIRSSECVCVCVRVGDLLNEKTLYLFSLFSSHSRGLKRSVVTEREGFSLVMLYTQSGGGGGGGGYE